MTKQRIHSGKFSVIRNLRKVRIFPRLLLSFVSLILIAVTCITLISFRTYANEIESEAQDYLSLLVSNVAMKIREQLSQAELDARGFYSDPGLLRALSDNENGELDAASRENNTLLVEHALNALKSWQKDYTSIHFITPTRQYAMMDESGYRRGGVVKRLSSFYDSPFYLEALKRRGYPVWIDATRRTDVFFRNEQSVYGIGNCVSLCVAVYREASDPESFLGVLVFNIDVNMFVEALQGYETYHDGNTFMIGEDGLALGFNPSLSAPSLPSDPAVTRKLLSLENSAEYESDGGKALLLSVRRVEGTSFRAVHIVERDQLLTGAYLVRNATLMFALLLVAASFGVSYLVTVSISLPIRRLISAMDSTGRPDIGVKAPQDGQDEVTALSLRFNDMVDRMNGLIERVYVADIREKELHLAQKNAEIDALQMQINPHFLHNTLDIIRWECLNESGIESSSAQMITKFSRYLRHSLHAGVESATLSECIKEAQAYLDVINLRQREKIQLTVVQPPDADHLWLPPFCIQPIVENAVVHGFAEKTEDCRIELLAEVQDETLSICLSDNGAGMSEEILDRLREDMASERRAEENIGMRNVNQRIKLSYGNDYGVSLASQASGGTKVTICLPAVRTNASERKG